MPSGEYIKTILRTSEKHTIFTSWISSVCCTAILNNAERSAPRRLLRYLFLNVFYPYHSQLYWRDSRILQFSKFTTYSQQILKPLLRSVAICQRYCFVVSDATQAQDFDVTWNAGEWVPFNCLLARFQVPRYPRFGARLDISLLALGKIKSSGYGPHRASGSDRTRRTGRSHVFPREISYATCATYTLKRLPGQKSKLSSFISS